MKIFTRTSHLPVPVAQVFAWHARNGAIQRLTPPWARMALTWRQGSGVDKGVKVGFDLRVLGIPMVWEAEHVDFCHNRMFRDRQVKGPFSRWEHTHLFFPEGPHGSIMTDLVAYQLPLGKMSAPLYRFARKELARMFDYRHRILAHDLVHYADRMRPMRILISGASGSIGSALVPFLQTCGHDVIRLVRHDGPLAENDVFWDPYKEVLDLAAIGPKPVDAVISLNGMDISRGKWTETQKQAIIDSRIQPTRFLVRKMQEMDPKPEVFISASAIGFYGEGADTVLKETDPAGESFISRVCGQWEQAALPAQAAGVRTVPLRIGVVLTPAGGALARMLPAFAAGCGARLGRGRQYMSWISMDDALGGIFHILENKEITGPVNLTAPEPVTNRQFTRILARVLSRPAVFSIPEGMAVRLWGEMGRETLLTSARVVPEKLMKTGFAFQYPDLEPALRHLLGRIDT